MKEEIKKVGNIEVGSNVWWNHDDYYISGVVEYFTDGGERAAILTDCGKVTTFEWTSKLHKKKPPKQSFLNGMPVYINFCLKKKV